MAETKFELPLEEIRAAYDRKNDSPAAYENYKSLMFNNLIRLINKLARQWSGKAKGNHLAAVEDLVNEAVVVLMENLDQYDPYISMPSTFFVPRFEAQLKKLSNKYPIEISDYYLDAIAETDRVLRENGYNEGINDPTVTIDLIVDVMDISVKRAKMIYELSRREYSTMEDPDYLEGKTDLTPEGGVIFREDESKLIEACEKLAPFEKFVIKYVLFDKVSYRTLVSGLKKNEALLARYSLDKKQVTGKFIKQIESRGLRKLRGVMNRPVTGTVQNDIYIQASTEDIDENMRENVLILP